MLFNGIWRYYNNKPCAIIEVGDTLLLVNENNGHAVAVVDGNNITVKIGWAPNFSGVLSEDGQTITWINNTHWYRP